MQKIIILMLLTTLPIFSAHAKCTQEQAFDKMMILGAEGAKRMQVYMQTGKVGKKLLPPDVTDAGVLLAEEKYTEACAIYDRVAKEYGVDFEQGAKTTLSLAELKKDGGKKGGSCSLEDASIRFLNVSNILLAKGLSKTLSKSDLYHQASQQITENPTKSCELTKQLAAKYKVSEADMLKKPKF